jgi:hypothetical protein
MLRIKSTIYLTGQVNLNNQNSKFKTVRMTAIHPISDRNVLVIGIFNFDIVCNLSIVIWDFSAVSGKANRSYLNQLELTLTYPCITHLFP